MIYRWSFKLQLNSLIKGDFFFITCELLIFWCRRRKNWIRCELLIYGWSFKWLMKGQTDRHTDKQKHASFKLQVNFLIKRDLFFIACELLNFLWGDRQTDRHTHQYHDQEEKNLILVELLVYGWTFEWPMRGQTDGHKHRQTETCINTITRPGLRAGPSEKVKVRMPSFLPSYWQSL